MWSYTYRFGVPYEKYKQLNDDVLDKKKKLQKALQSEDKEKATYWHLQHYYAGTEVAEFLENYLP